MAVSNLWLLWQASEYRSLSSKLLLAQEEKEKTTQKTLIAYKRLDNF